MMNKHTYVAAAIALLAAGTASAQSSVTVYGRLNVVVEDSKFYSPVRGNKHATELNNSASRLGFKGVEDLGGGLKAGFQLEHGFSVDTGLPASAFWGRQAEVYLSGGLGTLRLGRFTSDAYYATADYISLHNHDTGFSADALYAYIGRNSNKVGYVLPEFVKGLTMQASISLAEGTNASLNNGAQSNYDVAINYAAGRLQLGLGYEQANTDRTKANQVAVRALYDFGPMVLGAYVQHDKNGYGAGLGNRTTVRGSVMVPVGASEFHLNAGAAGKYSNASNSKAVQYTAGYNYNLSKRTKVYAYYTAIDLKDNRRTAVDYTAINIGGNKFGDFSSVALGMRHNF